MLYRSRRLFTALLALFVFVCSFGEATAQGTVTPSSLPVATTNKHIVVPPPPPPKKKVLPGETGSNCDVTVVNDASGGGTATIDPAEAGPSCKADSKVSTTGTFNGSISGIEAGDTVDIGQSNIATVTGEGGTVNISQNSVVTVKNIGVDTGPSITVNAGDVVVTVPPGQSVVVNT